MTANTAAPLQRPPQGRHKPAPPQPTAGGVRVRATLADFASIMGANFDAVPPRIRYRPLSKAIWAALMLDVGMLRAFVARATNPTDGSLRGFWRRSTWWPRGSPSPPSAVTCAPPN